METLSGGSKILVIETPGGVVVLKFSFTDKR